MILNILLGLLLSALTVFVHTAGLVILTSATAAIVERLPWEHRTHSKFTIVLLHALGLLLLLQLEVVLWAVALLQVGAFAEFEKSLYFSMSTFATVGYGDVMPSAEWGLLASIQGLVGFIIIGWSSAYLVTAGIRFGPFERDKHF